MLKYNFFLKYKIYIFLLGWKWAFKTLIAKFLTKFGAVSSVYLCTKDWSIHPHILVNTHYWSIYVFLIVPDLNNFVSVCDKVWSRELCVDLYERWIKLSHVFLVVPDLNRFVSVCDEVWSRELCVNLCTKDWSIHPYIHVNTHCKVWSR